MRDTEDPYEVADIIIETEKLHPELEIDPSGVSIMHEARLWSEQAKAATFFPDFVRVITNRVHLDREMRTTETHKDAMSVARSNKMGHRKYTAEAAERARYWSDRIWKETDLTARRDLFHQMGQEIVANMKAEGLWEGALKFQKKLRQARHGAYSNIQSARRRAYGFDDAVTPKDIVERVYGDRPATSANSKRASRPRPTSSASRRRSRKPTATSTK